MLDRWDVPDRFKQATVVEPRHAFQSGKFDVLETVPNWSHMLEEANSSEQSAFIEVTDIWIKSGKEMETF